jgi:hypothetical protein
MTQQETPEPQPPDHHPDPADGQQREQEEQREQREPNKRAKLLKLLPWALGAAVLGVTILISHGIKNFVLALPSILAMAVYLSSPFFSSSAKEVLRSEKIPDQSPNTTRVSKPDQQDRDAVLIDLDWLDWAIDYTQVLFVVFMPAVALLLIKPESPTVLIGALFLTLFVAIATLWVRNTKPDKYKPIPGLARVDSLRLTWLAGAGVVINIVIAIVLAAGIIPSDESPSTPTLVRAEEAVIFGEPVHDPASKAANVFQVPITFKGAAQALGNRVIWLANSKEGVTDPMLYFSRRPCTHKDGEAWLCYAFLGMENETGNYNLYAVLADDKAVSELMDGLTKTDKDGQLVADGHLPVPRGADLKQTPRPFQRTA